MTDNLEMRDRQVLWHPYTQHATAEPAIPVLNADGAWLHTVDGRDLLDCISSWWVTLHGHANPHIAHAVAEQARQLEQVIFAGFTHEPAIRLAEALLRILPPGMARVFYSDNGSTAVEVALKMVLQYWRNSGETRNVIVALENAYHGDTFGAMSASARGLFTAAFSDQLFHVVHLPEPVSGNPVVAFEQLLADRGGEVAAIIVEPLLQGAGGMRMWSADTLRQLRELATQHDVLFVADEVLTGFGRTGPLFASAALHQEPDIICLSKGLTGGFLPLGATVTTQRVYDAFLGDRATHTLFHGHSYTANPIACAAALASIELLNDVCDAQRSVIEEVHREGVELLARHAVCSNARVLGTVAAVDIAGDAGYLSNAARRVAEYAMDNGVFVRPLGNVLYLLPPYCISRDELEHAWAVLYEALKATADGAVRGGGAQRG